MHEQSFSNPPGYSFILIGITLACLSAFSPHYHTGFVILTGVLIAGLLPYMVYAVAVALLPGTITSISGLVLVALHTAIVASERFANHADYSNGLIYLLPIVLAIATLPLAAYAMYKTDTHKKITHSKHPHPSN